MADSSRSADTKGARGWSTGTKVLLGVVLLIIVIATLAVFTLTIAVLDTTTGTALPYTTTYKVTLPDGEPITIGSSHILVMSYNNEMVTDVDGTKEKLVVGQERVISPRHARITVMGVPVFETDFQITLTYLGSSGGTADFTMTVRTSNQVPELVLRHLIPPDMNAQPA